MAQAPTHVILSNPLHLPLLTRQIVAMVSEFMDASKAVFGEKAEFEAALMGLTKIQAAPHLPHDNPSYATVKAELDTYNNGRVHMRSSTATDFSKYGPSFYSDYTELPNTTPDVLFDPRRIGHYPHMCVTARPQNGTSAKACIDFNRAYKNVLVRDVNMTSYGSVVHLMSRKHPFMAKSHGEWGNAEIMLLRPVAA